MKILLKCFIRTVDTLVVKVLGWVHIPYSDSNFFYLNPHTYKGKTITLADGTIISKEDMVAELHIDNKNAKALDVTYANMVKTLHSELKALKKSFNEEPYNRIKAIYGVTVFYALAQRQGFTVINIESRYKRVLGSIWENILRLVLKKGRKMPRKRFVVSKECWLSRSQIENMT